jgi:RNA polymerase sigma-70 factor (ECF subfamily)
MSVAMSHDETTETASDETLVERFRAAGERACADELLRRHWGRLWSVVHAMVLNAADADDVVQEAALKALRGLDQFHGQASFSTWFHRIGVNTALRFLDRRKRLPQSLSESELAAASEVRPGATSNGAPDAASIHSELERAVATGIASLKLAQRTAMALVVIDGMSPQQAAEIEGCSVNTIYWRIHEARKVLQEHLADYLS